jgi:uncharacterized protein YneF (UPF0154 family)
MTDVVAVFIPIVMFLVFGIIIVTYVYFRSRERQLLIEKGLSADEIKSFFEEKRDPYRMLRIGIISIFFGLGLGLGMLSGDEATREVWMPMTIFVFTGVGFVVANLLGNKLRKQYKSDED